MKEVRSSNLHSVGYDEATKTLTVQFKSGAKWNYADVPPHVHNELMNAESVGGYYSNYVRKNFKGEKHDEHSKDNS